MKSLGRFRFYDVANGRGFRMVKMRYQIDEEEAAPRESSTRAELAEAARVVAEMSRHECPERPSYTFIAARERLERLRFLVEDAAAPKTHAQMLKEYAAKLRKLWERTNHDTSTIGRGRSEPQSCQK